MQQIFNVLQGSNTQQASTLPFDFLISNEETTQLKTEFLDILKAQIKNIETEKAPSTENTEELNAEIAKELEKLKSFFNEISEQLKNNKELTPEEKSNTEDKLVQEQALATISILDTYLDSINDKIEFLEDLKKELENSGVNTQNINNIIELIEGKNIKDTDNNSTDVLNSIKTESSQKNTSIIDQFANKLTDLQQLAEKIIASSIIPEETTPAEISKQEQPITSKLQNNVEETTTNVETPTNNISEAANTKEQPAQKSIAQIMQLFKDIKQQNQEIAQQITENKATNSQSSSTEQTVKITENIIQNTATETTINNANNFNTANQQQSLNKAQGKTTHAENTKSEYKELAKLFNAEQPKTEQPVETKPVENTSTQTFAPTLTASTFNKQDFKTEVNNNIDNTAEAEINNKRIEPANNNSNEASKAQSSSFNQQLYKIAQQTNIQNQINIAIKNLKDSTNQQIKIKLNPEELGSVTIEMETVNNLAKGIITVEKPELAQHLAQNLNKAFEGFKQSGINIKQDDIVIKIEDEKTQQQNNGGFSEENSEEYNYTLNQEDLELDIKV